MKRSFLKSIIIERELVIKLAINDCKAKYASSGIGMLWALLQPLLTIFVFWFVFEVGFRNSPVENVPFILWYIPAFIAWNLFSETVLQGANSLIEYGYLIKNINFKVEIIPVIKVVSALLVHIMLFAVVLIIYGIYGFSLSIHVIQLFYYFICMIILLINLSWLLSVLTLYIRDVYNIVSVFLQIAFWATPIFWNPDSMDPAVISVLKFNPLFYLCQGYRNSFISQQWFWTDMGYTAYFWIVTIAIGAWGTYLFKKNAPYFDDML